jgi:tetratricopeptide (TPR) repeat protein
MRKRSRFVRGLFLAAACGAALAAATLLAAPAKERELPLEIARLYTRGLYRQAVEALDAAVRQDPQDAALHYWLGRCFYELRDYNRAISSLERAVVLEPNRSDYHDWLGKSYGRKAEQTGRFAAFSAFSLAHKTHREFETAVRLDPANLEAQRDLIRYLLNAPGIAGGGEEAAQAQIRALAEIDPIEGQLAKAEFYITRKRFSQADEEYQKVLDAKPGRVGVYLEIAEYYGDRGDAERMSNAVEAGAPLDPSDRRLPYYRGIALVLANKKPDEAEACLRSYLEAVPNNANVPSHSSAHEWLGKLYENQGRVDKAAEEYQAALTIDPRNKVASENLKKLQKK